MKNNKLFQTNLLVSSILVVGFILTAFFSYRANYRASLENIEQVSSLTAEGIYYQLSAMLTKPVNISLTMAHDSLLVDHLLAEESRMDAPDFAETTKTYLETYQRKYGFDSVFLISAGSGRYYNFNGLDRVMEKGDPENEWYYELLGNDLEYSLNVDNDQVEGADNRITVFVNCKVSAPDGAVIGVVGVGIQIDYLEELLQEYEDSYGNQASLINQDGFIEISTTYNGYEKKDWFGVYDQEHIREQVLGFQESDKSMELWTNSGQKEEKRSFIVERYIPELSWYLLVEQNTGPIVEAMNRQLYQTGFILTVVILTVLIVITAVIRKYSSQVTELVEERQALFKKATEQLYDSIYELNLTKNCYVGKQTEEYFKSLGAGGLPFDQGLRVIARKQIKEEFREGYVSMFTPENAIREYEAGNNHLQYDFMISQNGEDYHWIRVETFLFYSEEDSSVHMFSYRRNIDAEKKREWQAAIDEMTTLLSKKATERLIDKQLSERPDKMYAFFIFDIDEFKMVNDRYGHSFGDFCICSFSDILKSHFREGDILGRIGGDEFAAFIQVSDTECVEEKVKILSSALHTVIGRGDIRCSVTASIGIALYPRDGATFEDLYQQADRALYDTKQRGKDGFTIVS